MICPRAIMATRYLSDLLKIALLLNLLYVESATAKPHCPEPIVTNNTEFPWNDNDEKVFTSAKVRCQHYFKRSPCLIKLAKMGERNYHATCGVKRTK